MNTIVVGLGSMGKRRIRLLDRFFQNEKNVHGVIAGVDGNESRREEVEELFQIKTYGSVSEAMTDESFDSAIISTSPLSHSVIIKECLDNNLHVFTEINLVDDGYEENMKLAEERKRVLFLSSTPMYRKEMIYLKDFVKHGFKGIYHYHIGQYLPEWHPWESYKNYFVGDKRSNGCREIFAIELPWITDAFGEVVRLDSIHKKVSNLELPYDDCYTVNLEHASGIVGNISIDVVTPKGGREFELWGEGKYIEWRGTPDTFSTYDQDRKILRHISLYDKYEHNENYNSFVVEDAYFDELVNFVQVIERQAEMKHTFAKDKIVLSLIDRIEE